MTEQDLAKIKFRCVCHLSMEHEHAMTYESIDYRPVIGMCSHVPYKDGVPKGRVYTHYRVNGKVFKSKAKLLEYLTELENNMNFRK